MTKLISTYARAAGLQIDGEPNIKEHFYPSPFDRYITIQTGSGQGAKNYDHFADVLALLKPRLDAAGITIVHMGAKDDPALQGVYDLRGKTTILQSNYLMGRTLLHLGNDSWLAHCAGWHYRPLVALYGSTSIKNHSPYWCDPAATILLESHRWGGVPTYSSQEPIKTINLIPVEDVANAVIRLLNLDTANPITLQSRMMGPMYPHLILDLIPNTFPNAAFMPNAPITVRMDKGDQSPAAEEVLVNLLRTGRKVNVMTNRPLNLGIFQAFRQSILSYNHELDAGSPGAGGSLNCPIEYVDNLKTLVPRHMFFTREQDADKVAALRFRYFQHCVVEQVKDAVKEDYLDTALNYLNWPKEKKLDLEREVTQSGGVLRFRSNKFVLSGGKVFLSHAHQQIDKSIDSLASNTGDVIDDPAFWSEAAHAYFFFQPS